ncbi:type II toxin-antitoxin system HicA family toxin [Candidatus Pacearchaeota archaeon]|nr:type II toxin-antitoxin system HicA family toxin [Candidatus Pacearchaeota archaeon]
MQKLPRLSGKEVIKIISKIGFKAIRQKGSHVFMIREIDNKKIMTFVPLHNEIDRGTLLEIIRQIGITKEEFMELAENQ